MLVLLILLTIVCFALQTLSLRRLEAGSPHLQLLSTGTFTGMIALALAVVFLIRGARFDPPTLLFGALFGLVFAVTVTVYHLAMHSGPLSYTTFFYSSSMLIPVIAGVVLWQEPLTLQAFWGISLFVAAFYCISVLGAPDHSQGSRRWLLLCFVCWGCNGMLSVILKQQQLLCHGEGYLELLFTAFASASAVCLTGAAATRSREQAADLAFLRRSTWPLLGAAAGSGAGNILITYLSSRLPGAYLFPFVLGGVVVGVALYSVLILREKLSRSGLIGIAIGLAAIIVINL